MVLAALHAALVFIGPSISPLKSWGTWAWVGFGSWTAWSSQVPSSSGYFLILWLIFLFFLPWSGRRFPLKHSLSTCFLLVGKKKSGGLADLLMRRKGTRFVVKIEGITGQVRSFNHHIPRLWAPTSGGQKAGPLQQLLHNVPNTLLHL